MNYSFEDSHHQIPKKWARRLNAAGKGLTLEDLISELNDLEPQKYLERSNRGRSYLRRFFFKLDDNSKPYEVEEVKSSIKMNLKDVVSLFYHHQTDSIYLSSMRCSCEACIVQNFLQCSKIKSENIFVFDMKNIKIKKRFPDGIEVSPFSEKTEEQSVSSEEVKHGSIDNKSPPLFDDFVPGEVNENRTSVLNDNGIQRIGVPKVEFQLDVILSPGEEKNARRMISRGSRTNDWTVEGFMNNEEYSAKSSKLLLF